MTKSEFVQKATIAGIEAGKHPSIAIRDAQFAASELERNGLLFTFEFNIIPAGTFPTYPTYPTYPMPGGPFYITCEDKGI